MIRKALLLSLMLGLVACGSRDAGAGERGNAQAANTNTADEPGDNYVATVDALPEGQRNGVLFRAIRDAGQDCQSITGTRRIDDQPGVSGWAVVCDGRTGWAVALKPDGTAVVSKAGR